MFERQARPPRVGSIAPARLAAAVTGSLVGNALLLLWLASGVRVPTRESRSPPPAAERIAFLEFPEIPASGAGAVTVAEGDSVGGVAMEAASSQGESPLVFPDGGSEPVVAPAAAAGAPATAAGGTLLRRGFLDPRLYPTPLPRAGGPPADAADRLVASARARISALADTLALGPQTLDEFLLTGSLPNKKRILPEDGLGWERSQLLLQEDERTRDSILRARIRAIRERNAAGQ